MLLEGKKGLILGVANNKSIAWAIAEEAKRQGASVGFNFLNEALEKRVRPLAEEIGADFVEQCDVQKDEDLDRIFEVVKQKWGTLDFVIHSVAFADKDDLKGRFSDTSRDGFMLAMDISAYSLVAVSKRARELFPKEGGGSIVTLSYLGAVNVVPYYRVMGVAKAALEACVRELSVDLGSDGHRVNAVSAGPIRTLAASGISNFKTLLNKFEERSPMNRLITTDEVARSSVYLSSNYSSGVNGEIHYVDCGFNISKA